MPEYRRPRTPGGTFFFTVNTYRRHPLLTIEAFRRELRAGIQKTRGVNPDFSPGFGILGQAGEAGWSIARRGIAVAMAQGGSAKM